MAAERLRPKAGPEAVRRALRLLSSILQRAVEHDRIPTNAARLVRTAKREQPEEVRPLAPATVEAIRAGLSPRDATLVSVLAYAGLRPGEALALRWQDIRERTLLVNAPKTNTRRTVRLLAPLAQDLAEWRLRCGRPGARSLVFPNREGEPWTTKHDWANWRARTWQPAAAAAGIGELVDERRYVTVDGKRRRRTHRRYVGASPYDLRHSFASLLLAEGRSVHYVARRLGHAPSMTLDTYGHVVDEFHEAPRVDAEAEFRAAREALVPASYLSSA